MLVEVIVGGARISENQLPLGQKGSTVETTKRKAKPRMALILKLST